MKIFKIRSFLFSAGLVHLILSPVWLLAEDFSYRVNLALFSEDQFFWPEIKAGLKPDLQEGIKIGVLPLLIKDYAESIPCDSCHRLSANGMEFYLENYFKDKLAGRFPKAKIELLAPHLALIENRKMNLMRALDSLVLPWEKWFPDSSEELIYRPKDKMTSLENRKRLDQIGGLLDQNYLLIPQRVHIFVKPILSNAHTGGFIWSFALVFWNVQKAQPEWAVEYSGEAQLMDLDKSLNNHLDKALGSAWDGLPKAFQALKEAEPR